ncbi:hypothetical protein AMS62_26330 [Bacillus sp. FJAT-18019]|nr:hypothetical protein AMS62_26330 [Bacillus sp. FJAT-18019]
MNDLQFRKSDISTLLIAEEEQSTWSPCWRAFISNEELSGTTFPLQKLWNQKGIFIFAKTSPQQFQDFIQKVRAFVTATTNDSRLHTTILILSDSNAGDLNTQNAWYLNLRKAAQGTGRYVSLNPMNIDIGRYVVFSIPEKCSVRLDTTHQHVHVQKMNPSPAEHFIFSRVASQSDTSIRGNEMFLPFIGPSGGSFRFLLDTTEQELFINFEITMNYYYSSESVREPVQRLEFPIFQPRDAKRLSFQASVDPANQENMLSPNTESRTFLAFDPDWSQSSDTLSSYYVTQFGHEVRLIPSASYMANPEGLPYLIPDSSCGMMVFSRQRKDSISDEFTMRILPRGRYHLEVPSVGPSHTEPVHIICGISGTETIACLVKTEEFAGDILDFQVGHPGYSPIFGLEPGRRLASYHEPLLTDDFVTTRVAVRAMEGRISSGYPIRYLSQPEEEAQFQSVDHKQVLDFYESTVADLTNAVIAVPLIPHAGITPGPLWTEGDFERRIAALVRKEMMDSLFFNQVQPLYQEEVQAATPQGLLVHDNGSQWTKLLLAKSKNLELSFRDVSRELKNAFQTNQMFLVISRNLSGRVNKFDNLMSIAGWPFQIQLPIDDENSPLQNVIVFKYGAGTVLDYVKDPKRWTRASEFNKEGEMIELANWLNDQCEEAISLSKKDDDESKAFENLASILQDETWNGMLSFRVSIIPQQMPKNFKCLLGGMDPANLFAHHFGFAFSRISSDDAGLQIDDSSLFGLIRYKDAGMRTHDDDSAFDFKVTKLEALFLNSELALFDAKMNLAVRKLFGNNVMSLPNIEFESSQEEQNGIQTYVFRTAAEHHIELNNNILPAVQFIKASFETLDDTGGQIKTRFSFQGSLIFGQLAQDVFSFADDVDPTKATKGLAYTNLGVQLVFPEAVSFRQLKKDFAFDPFSILLDRSQSFIRENSLLKSIPLEISKFITGKGISELLESGYMPVSTGLEEKPIDKEEWFGIEFILDLGSLGGLGSNPKVLANVAVCWSADCGVFVGLRIPGVNMAQRLLKLQQVVDTQFEGICLADEGSSLDGNRRYSLVLQNLTQRFLGQTFSPETGDANKIILFPGPDALSGSLGWYGAVLDTGGSEP